MKFDSKYSGSKGNFYIVTAANGTRLLIDPGVTWTKLRKALNNDLSNIAGCLCSHSHFDHSKAVEDVLENGIDVYSAAETFEALGVVHRRAKAVYDCHRIKIGDTFEVFPFALWADKEKSGHAHDVPIFGFVIFDMPQDGCMLFVTDACVIVPTFGVEDPDGEIDPKTGKAKVIGTPFNIIALCVNYDKAILQKRVNDKDINEEVAKRLLTSHMEKQVAMDYINKYCCLDKCREIHLLHLSNGNIDAEKTRKDFEDKFYIKTLIAGRK